MTLLKIYVLSSILVCNQFFAASVVSFDAQKNTVKTVPVKAYSFGLGSTLYCAAHEAGAGEYALSRLEVNDTKTGLWSQTPAMVTLNSEQNKENPLFNSAIDFISSMGSRNRLAVVRSKKEPNIYLIDRDTRTDGTAVYMLTGIKDADGKTASSIVGLTGGQDIVMLTAVTGAATNQFGDSGSGIAAQMFWNAEITDADGKKVIYQAIRGLDCQNGIADNAQQEMYVRAYPLTNSSESIALNCPVQTIENDVCLHWDHQLHVFYIGLKVTGGPSNCDGARALLVGIFDEKSKMHIYPSVPESVFGQNEQAIVGKKGAHAHIDIHGLHSLYTSTHLTYLIVHGGQGNESKRLIYALPQVNLRTSFGGLSKEDAALQVHGTIADKHAEPETVFSSDGKQRVLGRRFVHPATSCESMPCATDAAVVVGCGPVGQGTVTQVAVRGDAIFAAVRESTRGVLFFSRALFDDLGKIKGWTAWKKAARTDVHLSGFTVDIRTGNYVLVSTDEIESSIKRIVRWGDEPENVLAPLGQLIKKECTDRRAVCDRLFDFDEDVYGVPGCSLLVATHEKKIQLIQMDATDALNCVTVDHDAGLIEHVALVRYANKRLLFVSGSKGVFVATQAGGASVCDVQHLFSQDKPAALCLRAVGNYALVKKVVTDGDALYVLTHKQVDRIDMTGLLENKCACATVAHVQLLGSKSGGFFDLIVSGKLALLATTGGIFRIGNGKNIEAVADCASCNWTLLPGPYGMKSVEKMVVLTQTGRAEDTSRFSGAMMYGLYCDRSTDRSVHCRFSIKNSEWTEIDDSTVLPVADFVQNTIMQNGQYVCPFRYCGQVSTLFEENGATFLTTLEGFSKRAPCLLNGNQVIGIEQTQENDTITSLLRLSTTGNWIVAGNFGLRVHE